MLFDILSYYHGPGRRFCRKDPTTISDFCCVCERAVEFHYVISSEKLALRYHICAKCINYRTDTEAKKTSETDFYREAIDEFKRKLGLK